MGRLHDSAAIVVIRPSNIVTLRLDLVIVAPALTLCVWVGIALLRLVKHNSDGRNALSIRAAGLSAVYLFVMLHEKVGGGLLAEKSSS